MLHIGSLSYSVWALTSDLLLQVDDNLDGLLQNQELGLGLVVAGAHLHLTHAAQLLEGLVDVAHAQTLPLVVGLSALLLALHLHLRREVLVILLVTFYRRRKSHTHTHTHTRAHRNIPQRLK